VEQPTTAELQRLAHDTFGRQLSVEQVEAYRGRLPIMVRAIHILRAWEPQLRDDEPAAVYRTPSLEGHIHGLV
jgi:hypothetical protein